MIANAQLEDDAEFQCQVMATENTPPLTSRKATLTILGKFTHPAPHQLQGHTHHPSHLGKFTHPAPHQLQGNTHHPSHLGKFTHPAPHQLQGNTHHPW